MMTADGLLPDIDDPDPETGEGVVRRPEEGKKSGTEDGDRGTADAQLGVFRGRGKKISGSMFSRLNSKPVFCAADAAVRLPRPSVGLLFLL